MLSLLLVVCAAEPYRVTVTDPANGWPVPLVELRSVDGQRFITDNAGVAAMDSPDLMNRETWFHVAGHGYEMPKDGFGYRGLRLTPTWGGSKTIDIQRIAIAERVGRVTGSGLFAESQKCGREQEWSDGPIVGCDSVQTVVVGDRRLWIWGDTSLPGYPLGLFQALGAVSKPQPFDSLRPPFRPSFDYVQDDRKPRNVAVMPGHGPTWISALTKLPDANGLTRIVASYVKVEHHLDVHTVGLAIWDETARRFQPHRTIWSKSDGRAKPIFPDGHASEWTDDKGRAWRLFGNPFPQLKCPATVAEWEDPKSWERIETPPSLTGPKGEKVTPHTGSIAYLPRRKEWIAIFNRKFGSSPFGEVWCAWAPSPWGPWQRATMILAHDNYTFYNPRVYGDLGPGDDPHVFFEGTYSAEFASQPAKTPRYDYNQVLYRLNLDHPGLRR